MTYENLLNSPLLHLPLSQNGKSVKSSIKSLLNKFIDEIESLDDGPLGIDELQFITGNYVKMVQSRFIDGLLRAIDLHHDGRPAKAFERLSTTLNNDLKDFTEILKIRTYSTGNSFFRMRVRKGNFPLSPLEMFHIPFELRGVIATQRYSIPGFPCLYLGRTLYGCWEEMNRPEINEFQVVRLKNIKEIKYLDLTRPKYEGNLRSKDIYHYFMTWPLIACCSVKVKDYSNSFKSEYIIPQLLLQWVRENQTIDGIRFNSTHIDFHNSGSDGDFSNLVLPVKTNKERGHCSELGSVFEISNTLSWQMHEHAIGGQIFMTDFGNGSGVDSRISKLELIKGLAYPYSYSVLGKLESFLENMRTSPVEGLINQ